MKKETAMQQLKDKIQVVIGEMNGELNSYQSGYKQCLINIQNDIHAQMLGIEKEQILEAFDEGQEYEYQYHINSTPKFDSQTYYNETYGSDK